MNKIILYFSLFTLLCTSQLSSQTTEIPLTVPILGDHKFTPNNYVKDPFIKTYIKNSLGYGQALDVNIPLVIIDGQELLAIQGDILFTTLDFEYHHRVKDWLGVWGRIIVLARLGSNTQALLAEGVTAVSGFDLGWLFKLHQTKNSQLSGSLSLTNSQSTIVNLLDFVDRILDGDFSPNNQLVKNVPALRGTTGLRYAWAMNDFFGTYLLTELSYGQSAVQRNEGKFFYQVAGVLDFDLSTRTVLPFGVALGAAHNSLPRNGEATNKKSQSVFLRIDYNSQPDFLVGIELSTEFLPLASTGKTLTAAMTSINMRYYFH